MRRFVLAALLLCACEGEPAQQPNVFEKTALDGRYCYAVDLVDAPPSVTGLIAPIEAPLVTFDPLEAYLIARDAPEAPPLGAWRIHAHFDDPPRQADPGDGIILEGGGRPWYQRAFVRVDFSSALVAQLAGWSAWPGDVTEPVATFVGDPASPDAIRRELLDGKLVSLAVTHRLLVRSPELGDVLVKTRHTFTRAPN